MNIVPHVSENFDEIINSTKNLAKSFIRKRLEQLDLDIYCSIEKRRFRIIKKVERTILTTAGIIKYTRRYYFDEVKQKIPTFKMQFF